MEHQREIFQVLTRLYRHQPPKIKIRQNPALSAAIISGAQTSIRKPFFRTWPATIPEVALKEENTFVSFWPTILLAGPQSQRIQQFWDGGGNFLSNVPPGVNHRLCGYADLSFTIVLSDEALAHLAPLLESRDVTPAEREAQQERERLSALESIPAYQGPTADPATAAEIERILNEIRGGKP